MMDTEVVITAAPVTGRDMPGEIAVTEYEEQQTMLLYKNAASALAATIATSSLVVYYFSGYTDQKVLMSWYLVLFVLSLLRYVLVCTFQTKYFNYKACTWVRLFEVGAALSGMVWGSAALFIIPPDSFIHHAMLAFVLGGLCAGTLAIYTISKYASPAFTIFSLSPLIYSLHISTEALALPMEVLALMYLMSLLVGVTHIYKATRESIMLDMHNKGLVKNLSHSLNEMDGLNTLLRKEIKHRTTVEDELSREKELAEVTLSSLADGVITTNSNGEIDYMNPAAELLTCQSMVDVQGRPVEEVFTLLNETVSQIYQNKAAAVIDSQARKSSGRNSILLRKRDERLPIIFTCSPMRNSHQQVIGSVIIFKDVSELRRLEDKLSFEASHDFLTGLMNRREFEFRLTKRIQQTIKSAKQQALLYLDLDQFKVVNDTCGHVAGDELLKQVSNCISLHLDETDSFARLGGDEFGILLDCSLDKAKRVAETLRNAISKMYFKWDEKVFETSVSIGVVPITATGSNLADLMRSVDSACYIAKDTGRNRIYVISEDDTAVAARYDELQWVHGIKQAIKDERIVLFVQRILPLNPSCTETHYEILMRMKDKDGKLIPPMEYIPAAERYDLMSSVDRYVSSKAFTYIKRFLERFPGKTLFSINLSGHSLRDERFLSNIIFELRKSGVPAKNICFEITETVAIGNLQHAQRFMSVLHDMGCQFSLDDFGSGLSSFAYLKNLDVNYLKIDGCFIRDIANDKVDEAMVKSINQVGHVLGMRTIAEFVENDEIMDKLKEIGVDYVQGYGVEKPHPFEDLLSA